jgi:hypothetical protein
MGKTSSAGTDEKPFRPADGNPGHEEKAAAERCPRSTSPGLPA